jgi:hypothetical protein
VEVQPSVSPRTKNVQNRAVIRVLPVVLNCRVSTMINWSYFPRSCAAPGFARSVVDAFVTVQGVIDSSLFALKSNEVLAVVKPGLEALGFRVEVGKRDEERIRVPVLFGRNGVLEKAFDADAYHEREGFVVEVEAGRGVTNYQFLKDLFQACMMVNVRHLAVAVRNEYKGRQDYEVVERFFGTLYASQRLQLPLHGVLVIGY